MKLSNLPMWILHKLKAQRRRKKTLFAKQWLEFLSQSKNTQQRFQLEERDQYPCLHDAKRETPFDAHYLYHTGWAARILARTRPTLHTDIGSSLYFISIASAIVPMDFRDFRPARLTLPNLVCGQADLNALPFVNDSLESLSCMHVVEHVGLGRYGDFLDYDGDLKAMAELKRVVAPGGRLFFVVPIGIPKIQFNAHRIYSYSQIIEIFKNWKLESSALVTDKGDFEENAEAASFDAQRYGCGCFCFQRKSC